MVINPYADGKITEVYPQLLELSMNRGVIASEMDKQFRYLSFVWDFNSPMVIEFTDLKERRKAAAVETGYKGQTDPALEVKFINTIVRNRLWLLKCSSDATYYEFAELLSKRISAADGVSDEEMMKGAERKIKLLKGMAEIQANDAELIRKLYEGDEGLEDASTGSDLTPESIGRMVYKK